MAALLEVDEFVVRRADGWTVRLPALQLSAGEVVALHGPSGCGKTTVLNGLFGLLDPAGASAAGGARWRGVAIAQMARAERLHLRRRDLAVLVQDAQSALDPLQPVGGQIEQATECRRGAAAQMLARLGVSEAEALCRRLPHAISGGEAQRVLLAIAFLRSPSLVVADEPSASLDGGNYVELLLHLRALVAQGSALLLATHDRRLLRDLTARVFSARGGAFLPGEVDDPPWPVRSGGVAVGTLPVLAARAVSVSYGAEQVLRDVDLEVRRGEIVALVGESGAGKTTLGRILAGHRRPDRGAVERPVRRGAVQLVCQDAAGSFTPGRTLRSLLDEAKAPFFEVEAAARGLGLDEVALDRSAAQMSGGERRRAALLRALAVLPDVLVLDEPTASLDRRTGIAVVQSLVALQATRALAMVLITHDLDLAAAIAHRVVTIEGGRLCSH